MASTSAQVNAAADRVAKLEVNGAARGGAGRGGARHQPQQDGDNDSGVDESTQRKGGSVNKPRTPGSAPGGAGARSRPARTEVAKSAGAVRRTPPRSQSVPKPFTTYGTPSPTTTEKKVPMNKVKVGMSHSPNITAARSKIGSLNNAAHRPTGGNVKIENRKLDWKVESRTVNKNEAYTPKGGEKKIENRKLEWNSKSKVGSLANAQHKAGGGTKKIENQKLEWRATSKVGSTDYLNHKAGGGNLKIFNQKLEIHAKSKIGSLENASHTPGGGDKKIFNDVEYMRQTSGGGSKGGSRRQSASQLNSSMDVSSSPSSKSSNSPDYASYSSQIKRKLTPEPPPLSSSDLKMDI